MAILFLHFFTSSLVRIINHLSRCRLFCIKQSIILIIFIIWYLQRMKATKCPSDEISLTNKVAVHVSDFPDDVEYVDFHFVMQIIFINFFN